MANDPRSWPKTREFQNHHMDSTRWNDFESRDGDIVIATWAKSGTTWLQQIIGQFIFSGAAEVPVMELSPWLDYRALPFDKINTNLAAQTHRRFIKTHLPADALQCAAGTKYVVVARDGRDALWSWFEHHHAYKDFIYTALNESPGLVGPSFPRPDDDVIAYFHRWLDEDGYPAWPFFSNVQSWWDVREHPQVLLVHFDSLKADLGAEMQRIAEFLEFEIEPALWPNMVEHCTFDYMRTHAQALGSRLSQVFVDGGRSLINKGENKRWTDVFGEAELDKYSACAAAQLSPECARWLGGNN